MKMHFVTALSSLEISTFPLAGKRISDELILTRDTSILDSFADYNFINCIGSLEYSTLKNAKALLYGSINKEFLSDRDDIDTLNQFLGKSKIYLTCLWLAQDNSVDNELGFLTYTQTKRTATHSNFIATKFSRSDGSHDSLTLSTDAFEVSREMYNILKPNTEFIPPSRSRFIKGIPRLHRALYTIQAARACSDIGERVATYCTVLESLFSTNTAELSHQLSERVAFFLSDNPDLRHNIYKTIKEAYNVRSKIVHGDTLKANLNTTLPALSTAIDSYIRTSLIVFLTNQQANDALFDSNDSLDHYMQQILFGIRPCPNTTP